MREGVHREAVRAEAQAQSELEAAAQRQKGFAEELGATNAYLGVIPAFEHRDLAKVAGRLAADETMHYTALVSALGRSLPSNPLSFGG